MTTRVNAKFFSCLRPASLTASSALCAEFRHDDGWVEEHTLLQPNLPQMEKEVRAYVCGRIREIVTVAARSALKLEQPKDLRQSHALKLRFNWNPKEEARDKRIVLQEMPWSSRNIWMLLFTL